MNFVQKSQIVDETFRHLTRVETQLHYISSKCWYLGKHVQETVYLITGRLWFYVAPYSSSEPCFRYSDDWIYRILLLRLIVFSIFNSFYCNDLNCLEVVGAAVSRHP